MNNTPYEIGGNVLNKGGLIENLPQDACVEVPCLVNGKGVHPCRVGRLPVQCAAMNMTNINVPAADHRSRRDPQKGAHLSGRHAGSSYRQRAGHGHHRAYGG